MIRVLRELNSAEVDMKYYALEYFRGDDKAIVDAKVVYLPPRDEYYDLAD